MQNEKNARTSAFYTEIKKIALKIKEKAPVLGRKTIAFAIKFSQYTIKFSRFAIKSARSFVAVAPSKATALSSAAKSSGADTARKIRGFRIRRAHVFCGAGLSGGMAVVLVAALVITNSHFYGVTIGGQTVGYIKDEAQFEAIVNQAKEEISAQYDGAKIVIKGTNDDENISIAPEFVPTAAFDTESVDIVDSHAVANTLLDNDMIAVSAFTININGTDYATLATSQDAQDVLNAIAATYAGLDENWSGKFQEEVTFSNVTVGFDGLTSTPAAVDYLITGGAEEQSYEVQSGDTLSGIAANLGVSIEDIQANNPELTPQSTLHVGDIITLQSLTPYIHYETTGVVVERDAIPFTTREDKTDKLYVNEKKTIQEGANGEREVTRQKTYVNNELVSVEELASVTITEPTEKVVEVGTKARPAVTYSGTFSGGGGIVSTAYSLLGIPYRSGGTSPATGFDCGGFTQYVYGLNGIGIPRTATAQTLAGTVISLGDAQPGDIVAWGRVGSSGHVGIYIGGGQYIHSPVPGKSVQVQSFANYCPSFALRF